MSVLAIIQARVGSSRLPGKVLEDLAGETMLGRVVERTRRAEGIDRVLVATTTESADDRVVAECERLGVQSFRGSALDVLDRYYRAAREAGAEVIVRVTSDCPLLDPQVTSAVLRRFSEVDADYVSNSLVRTYPRGLDVEVMSMGALEVAWRDASAPYERAHVTPFLYRNPERFRLVPVTQTPDLSSERWTVDTPADLAFVRAVYECLPKPIDCTMESVLRVLAAQPALRELNAQVSQKRLEEG